MRKCKREQCSEELPASSHASARYCSSECYQLSRRANQRISCDAATMNQDPSWRYREACAMLSLAWKSEKGVDKNLDLF